MGRKKNELGNKYGKLLVIDEAPSKNGSAYWLCQCDCGKQVVVRGSDLRYSRKSCGCNSLKNLENYNNKIKIDITGKQFGYLTAIKQISENPNTWDCQCVCGKNIHVKKNNLLSGNTTSCDCKKEPLGEQKIRNILEKNNIIFDTQKTFKTCYFVRAQNPAKFDFYVNNKYLIEYDGIQHFEENNYFKYSLKETQEHDQYKNQWCKENNIPLIRIPYWHYNQLCLEDLLLETSQFLVK